MPRLPPFPLIAAIAALTALAAPSEAPAQQDAHSTIQYRVELRAPRDLEATLQQGLALVRWEHEPDMSPELLDRLVEESVEQVRGAAAAEGYFSPEVTSSIDRSVDPWQVHLEVEPGERTRVSAVDIRFVGPAAEDPDAAPVFKRIRDDWLLRAGQPFRQSEWDSAKALAVRELSAWHYAAAAIADSRAVIDPKARTASLTVELSSGPAFRIGELRLSGLRRYDRKVVANMSPVHPGEAYEREKLDLYQRNLLASGYFVSAQIAVDTDIAHADAAPVNLSLIEAPQKSVETGLSYGTDTGPRVDVRYGDQDFRDTAWRFRTMLRVDTKIQDLRVDFDSPARSDASWNNFFAEPQQTDVQNVLTRGFAFGYSHNWGFERTPSSFLVSENYEQQGALGQETDHRHALYFGYRRTVRRTDNPVSPRSGYLYLVEAGGAPAGVSTRKFARAHASGSWFLPLGRRDDLLLRGELGEVQADSREGIPSTFLFRTGGDQTVRGYVYQSLGVPLGEAVLGGRRLAVASAEVTHWVGDDWGVAAFLDAGDAWDPDHGFKAAKGYGVGARFRTPIGPIRADLAYGERTHEYRMHFSVGYTF